MITSNSITTYPFVTMLINKGKKSFENIGRFLKKSGDTANRMLRPGKASLEASQKIAQKIFENKKNLLLIVDESTIKKIYSQKIEGTWFFFNTSLGRCIKSYRFILRRQNTMQFTAGMNGRRTAPKPWRRLGCYGVISRDTTAFKPLSASFKIKNSH